MVISTKMYSKPMIISIHSAKGGTGKTSITSNLALYCADTQQKILVVDFDFFTQGLTLFLSKGHVDFSQNITTDDLLKRINVNNLSASKKLFSLREGFYLLPTASDVLQEPDKHLAEYSLLNKKSVDSIIEMAHTLRNNLEEIIGKYDIDYVLIDARSGVDYWCKLPTLVSNIFWLVCEEDWTSQRASRIFIEEVNRFHKSIGRVDSKSRFDGFILNMTVNPLLLDLIRLFETSVFAVSCIGAIPLSRQVRRAFVKDEFVLERYPANVFSREIMAIGDTILNLKHTKPSTRARNNLLVRWIKRVVPASLLVAVLSVLSAFMNSVGLSVTLTVTTLAATGILLIITLYYYQQTD